MASRPETAALGGRLRRVRLGLRRPGHGPKAADVLALPVRVIEPRQPGVRARVREFWGYRRLTWHFGWQCVERLYRKTRLGWLWVPIRPAMQVLPRVVVFGGVLGAPSNGTPYVLFFLVGFSAWQFFLLTAMWSTRSIEMAKGVLRRLYVPRLTCLLGALVPALVSLGVFVGLIVLAVLLFLLFDGSTHLSLGVNTLALPAGLLLGGLLALAIGCFTSVLAANARDVRYGTSFALAFLFYLTPVIYPLSGVPGDFKVIASLNPMTAVIELIRLGVFGKGEVPEVALISCCGAILVLGIPGLWFFNRSESLALDSV